MREEGLRQHLQEIERALGRAFIITWEPWDFVPTRMLLETLEHLIPDRYVTYRAQSMRLSRIMGELGFKKTRRTYPGYGVVNGYTGIRESDERLKKIGWMQ